jgi:thioredoxin-like negative regulator of GroEL
MSMQTLQRANTHIRISRIATVIFLAASLAGISRAADNLRLNQHLDYSSDSQDGLLITGDHMEEGVAAGKPNYVIFYGEGCYNSKHQARRTVALYEKYKGRVQFVIVDLDRAQSPAQQALVKKYYKGSIPHVTILDSNGEAVYDQAGEVEEASISHILDSALGQ